MMVVMEKTGSSPSVGLCNSCSRDFLNKGLATIVIVLPLLPTTELRPSSGGGYSWSRCGAEAEDFQLPRPDSFNRSRPKWFVPAITELAQARSVSC